MIHARSTITLNDRRVKRCGKNLSLSQDATNMNPAHCFSDIKLLTNLPSQN